MLKSQFLNQRLVNYIHVPPQREEVLQILERLEILREWNDHTLYMSNNIQAQYESFKYK